MKTELNPYFERDYFENRHRIIDVEKFRKSIYIKHKYKCAACGEVLDNSEPIELHHIIPKSMGGTYSKDNIVPLHRTCHLSVTYARNK
jgi:RNA-directed DNA polymerase